MEAARQDLRAGGGAPAAAADTHGETGAERTLHMDIRPHNEAWDAFVALTKWSTIGVVLILVLLALFLL